jgi:hypothetical protein
VLGPQRLLVDRQRPAVGLERLIVAALAPVHVAKADEARGHVGVLGPQRLLADRQRPAVGLERLLGEALGLVHDGEVVEHGHRGRTVRS